jgi:hypothetical protein
MCAQTHVEVAASERHRDEPRYRPVQQISPGASVTILPGDPNTGPLRDFPPGPHSGVDPDPDAQRTSDSIDGRARNALTLGVLSLLLGVLTGLPAIWVGRKALRRINAADGALRGRWAAWAGIVLGFVGVAITIGVWIYLHQH